MDRRDPGTLRNFTLRGGTHIRVRVYFCGNCRIGFLIGNSTRLDRVWGENRSEAFKNLRRALARQDQKYKAVTKRIRE